MWESDPDLQIQHKWIQIKRIDRASYRGDRVSRLPRALLISAGETAMLHWWDGLMNHAAMPENDCASLDALVHHNTHSLANYDVCEELGQENITPSQEFRSDSEWKVYVHVRCNSIQICVHTLVLNSQQEKESL